MSKITYWGGGEEKYNRIKVSLNDSNFSIEKAIFTPGKKKGGGVHLGFVIWTFFCLFSFYIIVKQKIYEQAKNSFM